MRTRTIRHLSFATLVSVVAALAAPAHAQSNLLVDPGFESNPLESAHNVLNYFEQYQGFWGPERGTIVGQIGPVIPRDGAKMLQMTDAGGVTTQVFQVTDVSAYAALIDSGQATVTLSSYCNADPGIPAAAGAAAVSFYALPDWYSGSTLIYNSHVFDADPATWEQVTVTGSVPVGTRWMINQVYFSNNLLRGLPAYVDSTEMTITSGSGGFDLQVDASCPGGGPIQISWTGASPGGWIVLINALTEGTVSIPRWSPCGGTVLGLGSHRIQTVWQGPAGNNGSGTIMETAGPRACGTFLQLVDLANCEPSHVARIE